MFARNDTKITIILTNKTTTQTNFVVPQKHNINSVIVSFFFVFKRFLFSSKDMNRITNVGISCEQRKIELPVEISIENIARSKYLQTIGLQ